MEEKVFIVQHPIGFRTTAKIAEIKAEEKQRKAEERKASKNKGSGDQETSILEQKWDPKSGMSEALFDTKVQIEYMKVMMKDGTMEVNEGNLGKLNYLSKVEGALSMIDASEFQIEAE